MLAAAKHDTDAAVPLKTTTCQRSQELPTMCPPIGRLLRLTGRWSSRCLCGGTLSGGCPCSPISLHKQICKGPSKKWYSTTVVSQRLIKHTAYAIGSLHSNSCEHVRVSQLQLMVKRHMLQGTITQCMVLLHGVAAMGNVAAHTHRQLTPHH
jgi:hypothetical protein